MLMLALLVARAPGEAGLIGKKIYVGIILLFCAVTQGFFLWRSANFVSMEFFITQQLFQRPWESNHKPSAPTNDAPNNIVNTQSPVAVFYTASTNTLINIYSKYRTSRDKLPLSKWPTLLLPSPVTTIGKNSQTRSTCLFCSLALSWVHQTCLSWCQHKCLVLFRARQLSTQSQSGVRSITTYDTQHFCWLPTSCRSERTMFASRPLCKRNG